MGRAVYSAGILRKAECQMGRPPGFQFRLLANTALGDWHQPARIEGCRRATAARTSKGNRQDPPLL